MAIVDMCLAWLYHLWHVHLYDRTNRSHVSYQLSGCRSVVFRYLGFAVACVQQSCYGMCMSCADILWFSVVNDLDFQIWYGVQSWIGGSLNIIVIGCYHVLIDAQAIVSHSCCVRSRPATTIYQIACQKAQERTQGTI